MASQRLCSTTCNWTRRPIRKRVTNTRNRVTRNTRHPIVLFTLGFCWGGNNVDIADDSRLAHVKLLAGEVRDPFQGECLPDLKL